MANPKLFVSLPMYGLNDDVVRRLMIDIKRSVENIFKREFDLIDTLIEEEPPDSVVHHNYYLGRSIQMLSMADICVFHHDWKNSPGCTVEHMVCDLYDIPYIELKKGML